jgi:hypothetical protein
MDHRETAVGASFGRVGESVESCDGPLLGLLFARCANARVLAMMLVLFALLAGAAPSQTAVRTGPSLPCPAIPTLDLAGPYFVA